VTDRSRAADLLIALLAAIGVVASALHLVFAPFDPDEFQHAHIAWLIAQGEVPYRDFWEHHGPLFGLVNGALLRLTGAAAGIDLLFWCRGSGALATALIALFTALIARETGLGRAGSLLAAALLLAMFFVQDKGMECRPDPWQNALWFAGLWVLMASFARRHAGLVVLSGVLMGLAVLANTKAALGAVAVLLFYAAGSRLHRWPVRRVAADLGGLVLGGLIPYAVVTAWFAAHDAVAPFHFYNLTWNFTALDHETLNTRNSIEYLGSLAKRQLPFVLAALVGAVAGMRAVLAPGPDREQAAQVLLLVVAAVAAAGLALDLYSQYLLFMLPPWCVLAARGTVGLVKAMRQRAGARAGPWLAGVGGLTVATMAIGAAHFAPRSEHPQLAAQRALTARLLAETPRSEPIGGLWNSCGGYMFNARVQYFWAADATRSASALELFGTDPFAGSFVAALERQQVRYVVGDDGEIFQRLPEVTRRYLQERFEYADCLWSRR
jgi:hypothetical protein